MVSRSTPNAAIRSASASVRAPPTVISIPAGSRPSFSASSRTRGITLAKVSSRSSIGPTHGK